MYLPILIATRVPVQVDTTNYDMSELSILTSADKSYSVEDITAALDDMVQEDEFLKEADSSGLGGQGHSDKCPSVERPKVGTADDELDALTKALSAFPAKKASQDYDEGCVHPCLHHRNTHTRHTYTHTSAP